jgi:hypothetical protein
MFKMVQFNITTIKSFIMRKTKALLVVLIAFVLVFATFFADKYLQINILGIFDIDKHESLYTIDQVMLEEGVEDSLYTGIVRGVVYKDKEDIEIPYVIVGVDFYYNGYLVDTKTTTLDTSGIKVGETRNFEVQTSEYFTEYKYYLR